MGWIALSAKRRRSESRTPNQARDIALDIAFCATLFIGIWLSRAIAPGAIVTWDEPAWVYRSVKFLLALRRGDFSDTVLIGHPGVITMWSGALSLACQRWITGAVSSTQLTAIDALPDLDVHNAEVMRQLGALLPATKAVIAILHAAIAVTLYLLLSQLLNRRQAMVATFFLVADPYYLALSRVLHTDALTAGFIAIAIISVLIYIQSAGAFTSRLNAANRDTHFAMYRYLFISAIATALAALSKSYGALITPFVGLCLLVARFRASGTRAERLRLLLGDLFLWSAIAALTFVALWPAMWVSPLETLKVTLGLSLKFVGDPGEATTRFFRGQVFADPGPTFYPVAMFFRTTPLVILGCFLSLASLAWFSKRAKKEEQTSPQIILLLWGYVIFYVALLTLSKKKFDRYALPAILVADILAAMGWMGALAFIPGAFLNRVRCMVRAWRAISTTVLSLVTLLQTALLLRSLYPAYTLAYYNPWAGGVQQALRTISVGWGEGVEQVAVYLANKQDAAELSVVTWAVAGLAPHFPGQVAKPTEEALAQADYVLLYLGDVQAQSALSNQFYGVKTPEFVAKVNGVEYAWLYANDYYLAVAADIEQTAQPGDVIVSNMTSVFQRRYKGALRYSNIAGCSEEIVAEELQKATAGASRLFYLEFQSPKVVPAAFIKRQLAQSALLIWQKPFVYGTLYYYQLPTDAQFRPVTPSVELAVNFSDQFELQGYGFSRQQVEYRQELGLALQWRLLRRTTQDYYFFAHLVDAEDRMWGQRDGPLTDEAFLRTSTWPEATSHLCHTTIPLLPGTPPGEYWLVLGLYRLDDLARLNIITAGEQRWATELRLGPITVTTATVPPTRDELNIPYPIDLPLSKQVQLLGYALDNWQAKSGTTIQLTLFWQCLEKLDRRYEVGLRLVHGGNTITTFRFPPAGAAHPTEQWLPGEVLRFPQRLHIPPDAASNLYDLYLNLCSENDQPLAAQDILLTQIQIEHVERIFTAPPIRYPLVARFGEGIELLGYDLRETQAQPGGTLHLTLYWRALQPSSINYTVFTHLLDGQGIVRGQRDSVPVGGQRPTTEWVKDEVIIDAYEIPISNEVQPGSFWIEIGFYNPRTGERLPVTGYGLPGDQNRILLPTTITVPFSE